MIMEHVRNLLKAEELSMHALILLSTVSDSEDGSSTW